ncbi:MAG: hypothetical protein ACFFD1_11665, partial [Candidatus Thorarchaeota archaeon]
MKLCKEKDLFLNILILGIFFLFGLSIPNNNAIIGTTNIQKPVVLIDVAHNLHTSDFVAFRNYLLTWGFDVIWNTKSWTSNTFTNVDIMIIPSLYINLTVAEINYAKTWFDSGNKSLWIGAESDFGSNYNWALRANTLLNAVGSSIYIESSSLESEYNIGGAAYRVSGTIYNKQDSNAKFLTSQLPYQDSNANALFFGPCSVIGKNSNGTYANLETNYFPNVEWVVKTKNATVVLNTDVNQAEGAQVHSNNQYGEFVLMALQHS